MSSQAMNESFSHSCILSIDFSKSMIIIIENSCILKIEYIYFKIYFDGAAWENVNSFSQSNFLRTHLIILSKFHIGVNGMIKPNKMNHFLNDTHSFFFGPSPFP